MFNLNKRNKEISNLLQDPNFTTKIYFYMSTRSVDDSFDPREKNYTYTNLNPIVIRGYIRDVKPEALVWKQYGLSEVGAKEVLCEDKYSNLFRIANKIEIDGDSYQVFRENVGNRVLITKLPFKLIKVVLRKIK